MKMILAIIASTAAAAAMVALAVETAERRRLATENDVLWEQIDMWRPLVTEWTTEQEARARKAVTN